MPVFPRHKAAILLCTAAFFGTAILPAIAQRFDERAPSSELQDIRPLTERTEPLSQRPPDYRPIEPRLRDRGRPMNETEYEAADRQRSEPYGSGLAETAEQPAPAGALPAGAERRVEELDSFFNRRQEAAARIEANEDADGIDGGLAGLRRTQPVPLLDDELFGRAAVVEDPATAIERLQSRALVADPFAAPGIRAGRFILRPSVETGLFATDNVEFSDLERKGALFSETNLRLDAVSDFSRHSASVNGLVRFRQSLSADVEDEAVTAEINAAAIIDLSPLYRIDLSAGYARDEEGASAPAGFVSTFSETTGDPLRQQFSGSAAFEKYDGPLRYTIAAEAERITYGDAELIDGTILPQDERDAVLYLARLRGGYAVSRSFAPFAELQIGRREYDTTIDGAGFQRSADRTGFYVGTEIDRGEKLNGEFAVGYLSEAPDDDRLAATEGLALRGFLSWSPFRETVLTLRGDTEVTPAASSEGSGTIANSLTLDLLRQIRADLALQAQLSATRRDYTQLDGRDLLYGVQIGAAYSLSRYLALTGRIRHDRQASDLPGRDYEATSVFAGLRLQR